MHNLALPNALTSHEAYQNVRTAAAACCRYRGAFRRQQKLAADTSKIGSKGTLGNPGIKLPSSEGRYFYSARSQQINKL